MEANEMYDAAIIGGGLGGLTLSIKLAQQGKKVLLVEKETYPFHKVCGEYISMESWDFIESCGIPLKDLHLPIISQVRISAPNGYYLEQKLGLGGFGISRHSLDHLLFKQALKLGVNAIQNCKVTGITFENNHFEIQSSSGIFKSYYTFGAYGKKSNIDVQLKRQFTQHKKQGKQNYIGVKYHIKTAFPDNLIALHNFKDGYCGISKIDQESYCLCYLTTQQNLSKYGNQIKAMEEAVLFKNPSLKKIFKESEILYQKPLVISQIRFEPKPLIEQHIIMLGDAAGLIAPLCGNGMSMAMRAADMISKLFPKNVACIEERDGFEKVYSKTWNKNFATRLRAGRIFQQLFGSTLITWLIIAVLKPFPGVLNKIIRATHGEPF